MILIVCYGVDMLSTSNLLAFLKKISIVPQLFVPSGERGFEPLWHRSVRRDRGRLWRQCPRATLFQISG